MKVLKLVWVPKMTKEQKIVLNYLHNLDESLDNALGYSHLTDESKEVIRCVIDEEADYVRSWNKPQPEEIINAEPEVETEEIKENNEQN